MSILGAQQDLLPPAGRGLGESELARIFQFLALAPEPDPAMPKPGQSRLFSPKWRLPITSDEMISTRPGPPPVLPGQTTRAQDVAAAVQAPSPANEPVQYSTLRGLPHFFSARDPSLSTMARFGQEAPHSVAVEREHFAATAAGSPASDRRLGGSTPKPVTRYSRLPNTAMRHGPRTYPIRPLQPLTAPPRAVPAPPITSDPQPEAKSPLPPPQPIQPATLILTTPGSIVSAAAAVPYPAIVLPQPVTSAPVRAPGSDRSEVQDTGSNVTGSPARPSTRVMVTRIRPAQKPLAEQAPAQPLQAEAEISRKPEPSFSSSLPAAVGSSFGLPLAVARVAEPEPAIAPSVAPPPPSALPSAPPNVPPPIWRRLPPTELPRPAVKKAPVPPPSPAESELEEPPPPITQVEARPRRSGRNIALAALLLGLPAGAALLYYAVGNPFRPSVAAVVDAPFVGIRAPVGGQLVDSRGVEGQSVMPDTILFTIQSAVRPAQAISPATPTAPVPETSRYSPADARALLDGINLQIAAAETATLPRTATGQQIAARLAQLADLRRQRDAAERQLQLASATASASNTPPAAPAPAPAVAPGPTTTDVPAGVAGLLWSVLVSPGATVASGATLAQVADCEKLFLTVPAGDSGLRAGQSVDVIFGQQSPVRARVRQNAAGDGGYGRVQLDLAPDDIRKATADRCPVGRTARVSPR